MPDAATALEGMAREQGVALLADPRLLESRLRADAPGDGDRIDVVLAALDAGVPQFLLAGSATPDALTQRLAGDRLLDPAAAGAAVAAWSTAVTAMTSAERTAAPATPADDAAPRPKRRLWRPILVVPAAVAVIGLIAAVHVPSPRADPVAPPGGTPATGSGTGTATGPAGGATDDGSGGTGTDTGSGDGGGTSTSGGGDGQPPADPEAALRAMFPSISGNCQRVTTEGYGVVHLTCPGLWLIQFATPEEAEQFFAGKLQEWGASSSPWLGTGAGGFFATTVRVISGGDPNGNPMIVWMYTSPDAARSVIGEGVVAPGSDMIGWWMGIRTPVVAP